MRALKDRKSLSVNRTIQQGLQKLPTTRNRLPLKIRSSMSQRFQAKSRLLSRFILSHRLLFITLVVMLAFVAVGISKSAAVKSALSVITGSSAITSSRTSTTGAITVHAAGRGKPYLNLSDGHSMQASYRGASTLGNALQTNAARARSL